MSLKKSYFLIAIIFTLSIIALFFFIVFLSKGTHPNKIISTKEQTTVINSNETYPPQYPGASWKPKGDQQFTFLDSPGKYINIQGKGQVSFPVVEYPEEFLSYYREQLINRGWKETGTVDGESHWSFWKRENKYFAFGYHQRQGSYEYILFMVTKD